MSKGVFPNPVHLANSNLFPNYFKTTAVLIRLSSSFVSPLAALHAGMAPVTHTGPHSGFKAKTRSAGLLWTRGDSSVLFCLFCSDCILSLLISFIALLGMILNILHMLAAWLRGLQWQLVGLVSFWKFPMNFCSDIHGSPPDGAYFVLTVASKCQHWER